MRDTIRILSGPATDENAHVTCPACSADIRTLPPVNAALRALVREWCLRHSILDSNLNDGAGVGVLRQYFQLP